MPLILLLLLLHGGGGCDEASCGSFQLPAASHAPTVARKFVCERHFVDQHWSASGTGTADARLQGVVAS